ncbi:MAG: hypothetical protein QOE65_1129 [Solirubrobacteraceae bacterium]|jgi:hypothetical protein|nr:hypothetical protein [Solirubrobacteraceae bacterium]
MRSRITYANVMSTIAVVFALGAGSWAVAAIPDRGGVYHACVSRATGQLRLVNTERSCHRRTERAIRWNRTGRQGRQGDAGTPGAAGLPGAPGTPGKDGLQGAAGATNVTVRSNPSTDFVDCLPGERAVGGGGTANSGTYLVMSRPNPTSGTPTGWRIAQSPGGANTFAPDSYVICAKP